MVTCSHDPGSIVFYCITYMPISLRCQQEGHGLSHPKRSPRSGRYCRNDIKGIPLAWSFRGPKLNPLQLYIAFDFFSITTLGGVKISALLFFRRIFCVLNRQTIFSILTRITITIVVLWTVTFLILTGLQCGTHFSALWSGALVQAQYCHISYPFLLGLTVSDFILDVWIICLPLPQVCVLRVNQRVLEI